jgi:hypothetical protein
MVTLAYLTRNLSLEFMPLPTVGECVSLPEDLIFVAYMDGTTIVKEPADSILEFSNVERLIMGLSAFDLSFVKDSDFRKQNTKICPVVIPVLPLEITDLTMSLLTWTYPYAVVVEFSQDGINYSPESMEEYGSYAYTMPSNVEGWFRLRDDERVIYSEPRKRPVPL